MYSKQDHEVYVDHSLNTIQKLESNTGADFTKGIPPNDYYYVSEWVNRMIMESKPLYYVFANPSNWVYIVTDDIMSVYPIFRFFIKMRVDGIDVINFILSQHIKAFKSSRQINRLFMARSDHDWGYNEVTRKYKTHDYWFSYNYTPDEIKILSTIYGAERASVIPIVDRNNAEMFWKTGKIGMMTMLRSILAREISPRIVRNMDIIEKIDLYIIGEFAKEFALSEDDLMILVATTIRYGYIPSTRALKLMFISWKSANFIQNSVDLAYSDPVIIRKTYNVFGSHVMSECRKAETCEVMANLDTWTNPSETNPSGVSPIQRDMFALMLSKKSYPFILKICPLLMYVTPENYGELYNDKYISSYLKAMMLEHLIVNLNLTMNHNLTANHNPIVNQGGVWIRKEGMTIIESFLKSCEDSHVLSLTGFQTLYSSLDMVNGCRLLNFTDLTSKMHIHVRDRIARCHISGRSGCIDSSFALVGDGDWIYDCIYTMDILRMGKSTNDIDVVDIAKRAGVRKDYLEKLMKLYPSSRNIEGSGKTDGKCVGEMCVGEIRVEEIGEDDSSQAGTSQAIDLNNFSFITSESCLSGPHRIIRESSANACNCCIPDDYSLLVKLNNDTIGILSSNDSRIKPGYFMKSMSEIDAFCFRFLYGYQLPKTVSFDITPTLIENLSFHASRRLRNPMVRHSQYRLQSFINNLKDLPTHPSPIHPPPTLGVMDLESLISLIDH